MKTKSVALVVMAALLARGAERTWMETPADGFWNATSLNWDEGTAWAGGDAAVFGASQRKDIRLDGDVSAASMAVNASGYAFTGTEAAPATLRATGNFAMNVAGTLAFTNLIVQPKQLTGNARNGGGSEVWFEGGALKSTTTADQPYILSGFDHTYLGAEGLRITPDVQVVVKQHFETAPGVAADKGLVKTGVGVLILESDGTPSTFSGGVIISNSQLRVRSGDVLGSGPVRIRYGSGNSTFFADAAGVVVTNRLSVEANQSWCGSSGENFSLELHNVGTAGNNTEKGLWFGRASGAKSRLVLALDDPASEAVKCITLRGNLAFSLDGGTLRALDGAQSPFFSTLDMTSSTAVPVSARGLTFETGGSDTVLGLSPVFDNRLVTNVVAVAAPANNSFENGWTGWTKGSLSGAPNGLPPDPQANGSAFCGDAAYYTTNGTKFAVLRRKNWMQAEVTVPEDGDWRVVFEHGCRPGGYTTHLMEFTVIVDAETAGAQSQVFPARDKQHPFRQFATEAFPLKAGKHTVRFETGTTSKDFESFFVDVVRLERWDIRKGGAFTKTGEGTLGVSDLRTSGEVFVWGGGLALSDYAYDGTAFSVDSGAALVFQGGSLANVGVDVKAGGTLGFRGGRNIVPNGDFEYDEVDAATHYSQVDFLRGWRFQRPKEQTSTSGAQRNGSTMSANGWYATPSGNQTAFIRTATTMIGEVQVPQGDTYTLSFLHCARNYNESYALPLEVLIDDAVVHMVEPRTAYYDYTRVELEVELTQGVHSLAFRVGKHPNDEVKSGALLFVDDIRLESNVAVGHVFDAATVLRLASGATLDLRNSLPIVLEKGQVLVDGTPVTGGRGALQRAGLTVTGEGSIQIGPADGTLVIIR